MFLNNGNQGQLKFNPELAKCDIYYFFKAKLIPFCFVHGNFNFGKSRNVVKWICYIICT